mmetsp:Transcript_1069/g.2493  ORF Transcript_1069/g.2493 Transcript_1069/m.2493 type:complete len:252 (+) Transcript_1069:405-1160(+)
MVFDVTVSQLALVVLVGAAVVGPRDLPKVARTAGHALGAATRFIIKSRRQAEQLVQEAQIPEIRQEIHKSLSELDRIRSEISSATRMGSSTSSLTSSLVQTVRPTSPPAPAPHRPTFPAKQEHIGNGHGHQMASGQEQLASARRGRGIDLRKELEDHLSSMDAAEFVAGGRDGESGKGKGDAASRAKAKLTVTEKMPSGADVVVDVLRQQKFLKDCKTIMDQNFSELAATEPDKEGNDQSPAKENNSKRND